MSVLKGIIPKEDALLLGGYPTKIFETGDAVPVVRCKECKYYKESALLSPQKFCFRLKDMDSKVIGYNFAEDDFCSYGERREE